jgi:hypothetical protein
MGNSLQMRAPTHYLRVDLHDPAEAEYWLLVLDATREQVETAVASVGRDARDVCACLQAQRSPSLPAIARTQTSR